MKNGKKVVMWAIIADLLLLGVLFVLCGVADRQRNYDGLQAQKNSTYNENNTIKKSTSNDIYSGSVGKDINTNLTMEDGTTGLIQKREVFGRDIYDRAVIPSGEAMGIYMKTDGVMVVDVCSFKNLEGNTCCPADGILQTGDYIIDIAGTPVSKRSELLQVVSESDGKAVDITYVRDGEKYESEIIPQKNENGNYLLGAWVKDDVSGIGTITFIDDTRFMALGHSISDVDTGLMMRCSTGGMYTTNITNISKSYSEQPGRLQGNIAYRKALVGIIDGNSSSGIYGHLDASYCSSKYGDAEKMYIARGGDVSRGEAYIYSRLDGILKKYKIEIEIVDKKANDKNIEFHVTDDELLDLTGGVVQGMSGSPIIQNGKIIGAVTHVFVDDPTRGYGIFIENMLEK